MRVIDLFSGAGGASEGMRQAGFAPTLAVDCWRPALATHAANHGCEHLEADIGALDPSTLGRADFVWGSPPCPDFSVANAKRDPERGMVLVRRFLDIVAEVRPRLGWVMENVPGVADYLPASIPRVELLNAADHGTPQIRRRIFAGSFTVPRPTHAPQRQRTLDGRTLEKWVSVREALSIDTIFEERPSTSITGEGRVSTPGHHYGGDQMCNPVILPAAHRRNGSNEPKAGRSKDRPAYAADSGGFVMASERVLERRRRSGLGERVIRKDRPAPAIKTVTGGIQNSEWLIEDGLNAGGARPASEPSYTIRANGTQHRLALWNGQGSPPLPIDLDAPAATLCDQSKTPLDAPAPAIVGGHREGIGGQGARRALAAQQIYRRLTPEECATLQGFPRDYIWPGSKTAIYKQIGNAVPPPVARAIAAATLGGDG